MIAWLRRLVQARKDQERSTNPGCERGAFHCLDQNCGCNEACPSLGFLCARMRILKEEEQWR